MNEHGDDRIIWTAPTHEHRAKSADWYWATGIITVALAIAFVISGNILLALIIIIGVGTLLAISRHEPAMIEYEVSYKGLRADKTLYPWDTLESFWILESTPETMAKLLLISKKHLMPHIVILIPEEAPIVELYRTLIHTLPEERQVEPLPDRLARKLGI